MYRPIAYFAGGNPFSIEGIMLEVTDMIDGDGDPTSNNPDAAQAALKVEPLDGVYMGDATHKYWINHLLLSNDMVILHVMMEYGAQYADVAYDTTHKTMAGPAAVKMIGIMLDGLQQNDITDYTEDSVRTWIEALCLECGYTDAVTADTYFINEVVEEQMKKDYYLIVATTGIDSFGLFSVVTTQERWWLLTFANNDGTIRLTTIQPDNLSALNNPHILILPKRITEYIPMTRNDTDPDDVYWEYAIEDIHAMVRRIRRTPPQAIKIEVTSYTSTALTLKVTAQGMRPPNDVRNDLIAQAEALI